MPRKKPEIVDIAIEELEDIYQRAAVMPLQSDEIDRLRLLGDSYQNLLELIKHKTYSLKRLQKMIFGPSSEKSDAVIGDDAESAPPPEDDESSSESPENDDGKKKKKKPKGHGRNGAGAYPGAKRIPIALETQQAGDPCPDCLEGTLYALNPGVLVRIIGQAPLQAAVYELEKLRCNLCGKVFTAQAPDGVGSEKYDATTGTMIGLLKYGSGLPFNRLRRLQDSLGIPLPASTQWDVVHAKSKIIKPAHQELIRQAAQGDIVYNDDTNNKILEFMGERARKAALKKDEREEAVDEKASKRTGLFTTGIVSLGAMGRQIAVFFTGRQHAGENLRDVLTRRGAELEPPIQMCDALSRNMPPELQTIVANCLAHGRRNFVDVVDNFPEECRYVLEVLKVVYKNDAYARRQKLSPEARLEFHQAHSCLAMDELHQWLERQIEKRLVEPNSGLGQAITYMRNHWEKLTLFLRKAGAPLDNNICERALKKSILHRKNSLFYKTQNGADVSDLFMSLIYTCELNGANPFDYLTELERHADELAAAPENWMPWNYRITLESIFDPSTSRRAG